MTFLNCCFCCSTNSPRKRYTKLPRHKKPEITQESGCYLTYVNGHVFVQWSYTSPKEGVLIFAKSTSETPEIKLSKFITDLGSPVCSEHFFKMILEFFKEAVPYKPLLSVDSEANTNAYTPFLLLIHSEGNGIIGGRVKTLTSNQQIAFSESMDCIGVMKLPESPLKIPNQNLDDFIKTCTDLEATTFTLKSSGQLSSCNL